MAECFVDGVSGKKCKSGSSSGGMSTTKTFDVGFTPNKFVAYVRDALSTGNYIEVSYNGTDCRGLMQNYGNYTNVTYSELNGIVTLTTQNGSYMFNGSYDFIAWEE